MDFSAPRYSEKIGIGLGYSLGYFFFTTALFLLLSLSHRLPQSWSYFHIMFLSVMVILAGLAVKRLLR